MKKSIFITVFSILIFSFTSKAQQCVSCYNNDVEFTKNASAVGQNNIASGQASFAMGNAALALGATSGAFGSFSEARAGDCFTFGSKIKATATSAFILGRGCKFTPDYLINNNPYTLMIGFNSTVPTFFISQSLSNSSVNNRTGMVGIGNVTAPEAKLHIKADDNENAKLYLQSHLWNIASIANIFIGNKNYGVEANGKLGLVFNSENNYVFGNGNVGIATKNPLHRLHVNGNIMLSSNQSSILFAADAKGEWGEWGIEYQNGGLNFWKPYGSNNFGNYFLFLSDEGNVGIGTELPKEKLDVRGTILTNGFKMPQLGMENGYVLTADRNGNSAWMPSQNLWQLDKYNNIYYLGGNVGIGTEIPSSILEVKSNQIDEWAATIWNTNIEGKGLLVKSSHVSYNKPILQLQDYNGTAILTALPNGKVGIGTNNPQSQLEVYSNESSMINVTASGNQNASVWVTNSINAYGLGMNANGKGYIYQNINNPEPLMTFYDNKVGIGADPVQGGVHKLYVAGGIISDKISVKLVNNWSDLVFNDNYNLMSLSNLEEYIKLNYHLPEIPSEKEIKKVGYNIAEMDALLLRKIEELTLYILEQKNEIDNLHNELERYKNIK